MHTKQVRRWTADRRMACTRLKEAPVRVEVRIKYRHHQRQFYRAMKTEWRAFGPNALKFVPNQCSRTLRIRIEPGKLNCR